MLQNNQEEMIKRHILRIVQVIIVIGILRILTKTIIQCNERKVKKGKMTKN